MIISSGNGAERCMEHWREKRKLLGSFVTKEERSTYVAAHGRIHHGKKSAVKRNPEQDFTMKRSRRRRRRRRRRGKIKRNKAFIIGGNYSLDTALPVERRGARFICFIHRLHIHREEEEGEEGEERGEAVVVEMSALMPNDQFKPSNSPLQVIPLEINPNWQPWTMASTMKSIPTGRWRWLPSIDRHHSLHRQPVAPAHLNKCHGPSEANQPRRCCHRSGRFDCRWEILTVAPYGITRSQWFNRTNPSIIYFMRKKWNTQINWWGQDARGAIFPRPNHRPNPTPTLEMKWKRHFHATCNGIFFFLNTWTCSDTHTHTHTHTHTSGNQKMMIINNNNNNNKKKYSGRKWKVVNKVNRKCGRFHRKENSKNYNHNNENEIKPNQPVRRHFLHFLILIHLISVEENGSKLDEMRNRKKKKRKVEIGIRY